jgi:SAM-dependent methyltransferase
MSETPDRDYVLGTHDEEIERLGLQHRVWRPRALAAWARAGFTSGQTLIDVGSGPGHASVDLAEIVGPSGRVVAIDRSHRFLAALGATLERRGLANVERHEQDLDEDRFPEVRADGAWARWVFAFVNRPRDLLVRVARALKPGGVLVLHEYCDYRSWRLAPRSPEHEEFVGLVMEGWRDAGGEPDIALDLPTWLRELGFEIRGLQTLVDAVSPDTFAWQWPRAFIDVGLKRFVALNRLTDARARQIWESFLAREARPETLMITPAVLEIVAARVR